MSEESVPQKPYGIVYSLKHRISGKEYVGQTTNSLSERLVAHKYQSRSKLFGKAGDLQRAILEDGIEQFTATTLATAYSWRELNELEIRYIQERNTLRPNGYNILPGGSSTALKAKRPPVSEETRRRMRESGKRRNNEKLRKRCAALRGIPLSPERIEKMRKGQQGRILSPEHIAKLKENIKKAQAAHVGIPLSPERRQKLIEAHTGKITDENRLAQMRQQLIDCSEKKRLALIGKPKSPGCRARISATLCGHDVPQEVRDKISATKRIKFATKQVARALLCAD
jgi:group I intron endonuclease